MYKSVRLDKEDVKLIACAKSLILNNSDTSTVSDKEVIRQALKAYIHGFKNGKN